MEHPWQWLCCHCGTRLDALAVRPNSSIIHCCSTCIQVPRFSFQKRVITPCACARGKVISHVVVVVVVDTKVFKSGDLGTWLSCKHNKYVEFGEKLALVRSGSSGTAYKRHKLCILAGHRSYTHWPCPLCIMNNIVFSAHAYDWPRMGR